MFRTKHCCIKILQTVCLVAFCLKASFAFGQLRTEAEIDSIRKDFLTNKLQVKFQGKLIATSKDLLIGIDNDRLNLNIYGIGENNDEGFLVVSCNKSLPEIIGYTTSTAFDKANIPSSFLYWLSTFGEQTGEPEFQPYSKSFDNEIRPEGVSPILGNIQWGQSTPYNNLCPTIGRSLCVTGCVATAMAQVMKHHQYPDCGKGSIDYTSKSKRLNVHCNFDSHSFQWDAMLQQYRSNYSEVQAKAVAELMFCCGASVEMDYDVDASGAYQHDLLTAYVKYFDYDPDASIAFREFYTTQDWHSLLLKELNEGRPVNYAAHNDIDGGHSFVIDGYQTQEGSTYPYYHLNWGWNGSCDGYYLIANLHPSSNGQFVTQDGFKKGQQMLLGVKPNDHIDIGINQLGSGKLHVSKNTVRPCDKINVYTSELYNQSIKTYNGNVIAIIIDSEGNEIAVGSKNVNSLEYMYGVSNFNIDITIPKAIQEGEYKIELRSEQSGIDSLVKIYSPNYPTITISESGTQEPFVGTVNLCATEMEPLSYPYDKSLLGLNVYIVTNASLDSFVGDLRMVVVDCEDNNIVASVGDSIVIPELNHLDIISHPVKLTGHFPTIPDGKYRLCVAAHSVANTSLTLLKFHESFSQNHEDDIDLLALPMTIKGGEILLGDQSYTFDASGIKVAIMDSAVKVFYLNGYYVCDCSIKDLNILPQGIYLLYFDNGERKKIFVK